MVGVELEAHGARVEVVVDSSTQVSFSGSSTAVAAEERSPLKR